MRKEIVVRNGNPEGVFSASCEWGYFSEKDGERHHFDLCESCYDDLVSSFKYPLTQSEKLKQKNGQKNKC